jgi:hypothetical protein
MSLSLRQERAIAIVALLLFGAAAALGAPDLFNFINGAAFGYTVDRLIQTWRKS